MDRVIITFTNFKIDEMDFDSYQNLGFSFGLTVALQCYMDLFVNLE